MQDNMEVYKKSGGLLASHLQRDFISKDYIPRRYNRTK